VPDYGVHDLNRIGSSKALLKDLLDQDILNIEDVPLDDERLQPKKTKDGGLSKPKKLNQILVHKSQKPMIDKESLRAELAELKFPLYFLDYETYPTSIPPFNGYRPYQHIVFQYSLHVLRSREAEPEHYECLIFDGDPSEQIAASLRKNIGDTGSVISWFKTFENSRNRELASIWPQYKAFFDDVISRTYDLMLIVENQHYVHPDFYGRSSIKKVLPALFKNDPSLSYKSLGVKNGTEAIDAYRRITTGQITGEEAVQKKAEMLEYCKLDTYAMYKLWKFFDELVNGEI
jgi:hypothetical protein